MVSGVGTVSLSVVVFLPLLRQVEARHCPSVSSRDANSIASGLRRFAKSIARGGEPIRTQISRGHFIPQSGFMKIETIYQADRELSWKR
jgi:hypothetical protein